MAYGRSDQESNRALGSVLGKSVSVRLLFWVGVLGGGTERRARHVQSPQLLDPDSIIIITLIIIDDM